MEKYGKQSKLSKVAQDILTSLPEQSIFQKEATFVKAREDLYILKNDLNLARNKYHQENYSQASQLLQPVINRLESITGQGIPKNKQVNNISLLYASALTLKGLINEKLKQPESSIETFKQADNLFEHCWLSCSEDTTPQDYSDYGITLEKIGRREEARTKLQEAVNRGIDSPDTYYYLGKVLKEKENYIDAEKIIKKGLQQSPEVPSIYQLLAEILEAQGKIDEATNAYHEAALILAASDKLDESLILTNKALTLDPRNTSILFFKAEILYKKAYYEEALKTLDQALDIQPENVDFLTNKAFVLSEFGYHDDAKSTSEQALSLLNKSSQLSANDVSILINLGSIFINIKCYEKAIDVIDKALALQQNYAVAWGLKGLAQFELNQFEQALLSLQKSIQLGPELAWTYTILGETLYQLERYPEALEYFNKALKEIPDDVYTLGLKGETLRFLDKHQEAIEVLNKAISLKPNWVWWLYRELAESLRSVGKYEEALQAIEKAVEQEPNNACSLGTKGKILNTLRRHTEATEFLQRSVTINPELAWAYTELGRAYYMINNYQKALGYFDRALEKEPNDFLALGFKGASKRRLGCHEQALQLLQESVEFIKNIAISQQPTDYLFDIAWIFTELAKTLQHDGRYEEAYPEYNQALYILNSSLQRAGNNTLILTRILGKKGQILRLLARYDEAIEALQKSVKLPSEQAWIHIELAEALRLKKADYKKAEKEINQALMLEPANVQALGVKGAILAAQDHYDKALETLDRASKLPQPDYDFVLAIKSEILCDIGEYETAAKILDDLTARNRHNDWLFTLKGWALTKPTIKQLLEETEQVLTNEQLQKAKQAYNTAKELNSENLWRHKGVAEILYLLNDLDKANDKYDWIIEQAEKRFEERDFELLGWCYYRLGQYAKAAKFFAQALFLCDRVNVFSTQFDLALALMCSQRDELALQEYSKGLKMISKKSDLKQCGLLSVALIDLKDAMKRDPALANKKEVQEALNSLKKQLNIANNTLNTISIM